MTIEDIRKFRNAQPFRPFRLVLSDGRKLLVTGPEKVGWSPNGRSLAVYTRGDAGAQFNVESVTKVQPARRPSKRTSK